MSPSKSLPADHFQTVLLRQRAYTWRDLLFASLALALVVAHLAGLNLTTTVESSALHIL